jgi:hypothetical protein
MQTIETAREEATPSKPHRPVRAKTFAATIVLLAAVGGVLGIRAIHSTATVSRVREAPPAAVSAPDTATDDAVLECRMWADDPDCFTRPPATAVTPALGDSSSVPAD